ncbi:MAG: hypothetical protein H0V31_05735 [Acidobacteria bacterium]|jgi:hypothetical protein|nr:hypothetical protein [Acidobacteriota bacterium]
MFKSKIRTNKLLQSLGILLILSCSTFAQERTWKTFSPDNGAWSILAPGIMKPDSEALESPSTKGSYSYNNSNGFFAVIYRDSPRRYVPWKPNYKAYYKKIRDDFVKAAKGQLLKDEEFSNGNWRGREIHIKIPSGRMTGRESQVNTTYRVERFRMFFHGKRFYLLLVVLPEDEINTPAIDNYLDSFVAK